MPGERGSPHKHTLNRTHNASEIQIVKLELALSANKSYDERERGRRDGVGKRGLSVNANSNKSAQHSNRQSNPGYSPSLAKPD